MTDRLLVYFSLLAFVLLFSLRLDNLIHFDYWVVFAPLWIWKFLAISSVIVAVYIWHRQPQYRWNTDGVAQYKLMMLNVSVHLLLFIFEVLVCDNMETPVSERHLWIIVCSPLLSLCILSLCICLWSFKHDRPFQLELCIFTNVIQFILVALRMDGFIQWPWTTIFMPLWLVITFSLVCSVYSAVAAIIVSFSQIGDMTREQRRSTLHMAALSASLTFPTLIFLVMLTSRLDKNTDLSYSTICLPLYWTLAVLILTSFTSKSRSSNNTYHGAEVCRLLMWSCPILQEYGNISVLVAEQRQNYSTNQQENEISGVTSGGNNRSRRHEVPVHAVQHIDTPD